MSGAKSRGSPFSTYGVLIYLGIVSAVAELAYGIINQSAIPPYVQELGLTSRIGRHNPCNRVHSPG